MSELPCPEPLSHCSGRFTISTLLGVEEAGWPPCEATAGCEGTQLSGSTLCTRTFGYNTLDVVPAYEHYANSKGVGEARRGRPSLADLRSILEVRPVPMSPGCALPGCRVMLLGQLHGDLGPLVPTARPGPPLRAGARAPAQRRPPQCRGGAGQGPRTGARPLRMGEGRDGECGVLLCPSCFFSYILIFCDCPCSRFFSCPPVVLI